MSRMTIGKLVSEAIVKMNADDPEFALFLLCAPIEKTAAVEYGQRGRASFKRFIHDNVRLMTRFVFGSSIGGINFAYSHPCPKPGHPTEGIWTIEDVLYYAIRCGFYHDVELPPNIIFAKDNTFSGGGGQITIPAKLIHGVIVAVIVAPSNRHEKAEGTFTVLLRNEQLALDTLWGKRDELLRMMDAAERANGPQVQQGNGP